MMINFILVLVIIAACCNAMPVFEAKPKCVKRNECTCNLKNVDNPGLINLHSLVTRKHEPVFKTQGKSEQSGRMYDFYYNPCLNFTDYGCQHTAICQVDTGIPYDLGKIESVQFDYRNNSVFAIYTSGYYDQYNNRSSVVELVCDDNETSGKFEYIGEPETRMYQFKLYTKCACPGKCNSTIPNLQCVTQDSCTCSMSDGSGTINLHSLDNPANPMTDSLTPTETLIYNPCSPVTSPDCGNYSVCMENEDKIIGLGLAYGATFTLNSDNAVSIKYATNQNTTSKVSLFCDPAQRDEPFFRAKDESTLEVYSVCACPDGCVSPVPPPTSSCDQMDSCTCKSDNVEINLHDLDNPFAPLAATDSVGYTYYYNPCSGIKFETTVEKCNDVAGCQEDPFHNTYYNIGQLNPSIEYDSSGKNFTFHYSGGQEGRSFDVRMVCDPDAEGPVLAADAGIPKGVLFYPLKLTTKYACF